jgi:hypothetical protein
MCFPLRYISFVKSSVRENKSYVKSVTNYLKEYDEWYIEAEQK